MKKRAEFNAQWSTIFMVKINITIKKEIEKEKPVDLWRRNVNE